MKSCASLNQVRNLHGNEFQIFQYVKIRLCYFVGPNALVLIDVI